MFIPLELYLPLLAGARGTMRRGAPGGGGASSASGSSSAPASWRSPDGKVTSGSIVTTTVTPTPLLGQLGFQYRQQGDLARVASGRSAGGLDPLAQHPRQGGRRAAGGVFALVQAEQGEDLLADDGVEDGDLQQAGQLDVGA